MPKKQPITDHNGATFKSIVDMCKYWHISRHTYRSRRNQGWSMKNALTKPVLSKDNNQIIDHLGNHFVSARQMCHHWNIPVPTYQTRIKSNWSLEKTLTTPIITAGTTATDFLENQFDSITEMCNFWHTEKNSYDYRISIGYSQIESLGVIPLLNKTLRNYKLTPNLTILETIKTNTKIPTFIICIYDNHEVILHRNIIIQYCINAITNNTKIFAS